MKKSLVAAFVIVAALLLMIEPAHAIDKKNVGCGVGYMLFRDAGDSIMVQVIASTLNMSFTQPLSITTGTAGCKPPRNFVGDPRLNEFVAANMDNLALDMAKGQGETLDTLAELMLVSEPRRAGFYARLQGGFEGIFTKADIKSGQLIDNIIKIAG